MCDIKHVPSIAMSGSDFVLGCMDNMLGAHSKLEYRQILAFSMQTWLRYLGGYTLMGFHSHKR